MKKRVIIIVIISTIVVLSSTVMYLFWVRYQNHLDYQQKTLTFIQQVELYSTITF
jgi:flagellar basal body-associated protein FliL